MMISANDGGNLFKSCYFVFLNECVNIIFNKTGVVISFLENTIFKDSFQEFKIVFKTHDFVIL